MYNAYIPGSGPKKWTPKEPPSGSKDAGFDTKGPVSALSGLLNKVKNLDTGDLLLLALLFLLLKEGEGSDWVLLLALASVFLSEA